MGVEQGPDYYDKNLKGVSQPLEQSPWANLYSMAACLLPPPEALPKIADIACGTGRFAKLLWQQGYTRYWGVDFSPLRIQEARQYVPSFQFDVGDVFAAEVGKKLVEFDVFVLLELLEHINEDTLVLSRIPPGRRVIFSVPNYDSAAHVRLFSEPNQVVARYCDLLSLSSEQPRIIQNRYRPERYIFLYCCERIG